MYCSDKGKAFQFASELFVMKMGYSQSQVMTKLMTYTFSYFIRSLLLLCLCVTLGV